MYTMHIDAHKHFNHFRNWWQSPTQQPFSSEKKKKGTRIFLKNVYNNYFVSFITKYLFFTQKNNYNSEIELDISVANMRVPRTTRVSFPYICFLQLKANKKKQPLLLHINCFVWTKKEAAENKSRTMQTQTIPIKNKHIFERATRAIQRV